MHRLLNLLVFLALVILVTAGPAGLVDTVYGQNSDTDYFRAEAELARAYAERRRAQANQWSRRAEDARERAESATNAADRENWLDDARYRQMRAGAAALDADEAEAKAVKAEAELNLALIELERDPEDPAPPEPTAANGEPGFISLEQTIGLWRIKESDNSFVIVQEEPGSPIHGYKLEAHTGERVWRGEYSLYDEGDVRRAQNARVVFKYKPTADEMNPDIPLWARTELEDRLEWEIELDEAEGCGISALSGNLFPGQVKWSRDEEDGDVEIIGRGEPRPVELERGDDLELDMIGRPGMSVNLGGDHDPLLNPIEGLTKRQRFFVKVRLPKEMAEEQGATLDVVIKGLTGGASDTITLTAGGARNSLASVTYTHARPATIADSTDIDEERREHSVFTWGWWLGRFWGTTTATGAKLDLNVENGELVEFRFGDMWETIPVYNSWVEINLVAFKAGADRLRGAFESVRDAPNIPERVKAEARLRLGMLDNLQTIVDRDILTNIEVHELYKRYIGEAAGIVLSPPGSLAELIRLESWRDTSDPVSGTRSEGVKKFIAFVEGLTGKDLSDNFLDSFKNVEWASPEEGYFVKKSLHRTRRKLLDRSFDEISEAYVTGLYNGIAITSGAGAVYLVATGRDHFDRTRTWTDRVMAGVGLASGTVLHLYGATAWNRFSTRVYSFRRMGSPVRTRRVFRGEIDFWASFPDSLNPGQRAQLGLSPPPGPLSARPSQARTAARYPNAPRADAPLVPRRSGAVTDIDFGIDEAAWRQDLRSIDDFYDGKAWLVDPVADRAIPAQCYENCGLRVDAVIIQRYAGVGEVMTDVHVYARLRRLGIVDADGMYQIPNTNIRTNPLTQGAPDALSRDLMNAHGFQISEMPRAGNAGRDITDIVRAGRRLRADEVKLAIDVGDLAHIEAMRKAGRFSDIDAHAVLLHRIEYDPAGKIKNVIFVDPAVGRLLGLDACEFNRRLVKDQGLSQAIYSFAPPARVPVAPRPFIEWPIPR